MSATDPVCQCGASSFVPTRPVEFASLFEPAPGFGRGHRFRNVLGVAERQPDDFTFFSHFLEMLLNLCHRGGLLGLSRADLGFAEYRPQTFSKGPDDEVGRRRGFALLCNRPEVVRFVEDQAENRIRRFFPDVACVHRQVSVVGGNADGGSDVGCRRKKDARGSGPQL